MRQNNVVVKEVVGVWLVVRDTPHDALSKGTAACQDQAEKLEASVGIASGTKIADPAGQTIMHRMWWCMDYYANISLPRDSLIFDASADPIAAKHWDNCVAAARTYTPNSDPPSSIDPRSRSRSPDVSEPRVEQTI